MPVKHLTMVDSQLLSGLRDDLGQRRIGSGMARLDRFWSDSGQFPASDPDGPGILCYVAQWVDAGWRDINVVQDGLAAFPAGGRGRLRLVDFVHVLMAEGALFVANEDVVRAQRNFDLVLALADELADPQLLSLAHFWKCRCHRKQGEYEAAMEHVGKGYLLACEAGMAPMAAAMRVAESWLLFQKGRSKEALRLLGEAESVLSQTDDRITLGNIESSYGRMYRREGRYDLSLRHFARAIEEYARRAPEHRNLARSLANMGYVERLVALQLRKRLDADAEQKRKGDPALRRQYEKVIADALSHLDRASAIYAFHHHYRGSGTAFVNRGFLHLDAGDLQRAESEAIQAYTLGEEKKDFILMARARLLQCLVANTKLEEGIDDPAWVAKLALDYAGEAVDFARHTENRRLLSRALIWQGLTLCNTSPNAVDQARELSEQAATLLKNEVQDHIWEDLQMLKSKVVKGGKMDSTLQAWSQGVVGERSFNQLTEDFADLIIPKVWEHEGRKVARVAKRLAVSPKKVRRVLGRLGLHGGL